MHRLIGYGKCFYRAYSASVTCHRSYCKLYNGGSSKQATAEFDRS